MEHLSVLCKKVTLELEILIALEYLSQHSSQYLCAGERICRCLRLNRSCIRSNHCQSEKHQNVEQILSEQSAEKQ